MPLTMLPTGTEETVKAVRGKDDTRRFLESLGFVEGGAITVVSQMAGNVIVSIKGTRVAISKSMANRIMV